MWKPELSRRLIRTECLAGLGEDQRLGRQSGPLEGLAQRLRRFGGPLGQAADLRGGMLVGRAGQPAEIGATLIASSAAMIELG